VTSTLLPRDYSDLEPYASTWCLPTEANRYARRLGSTIEEMQEFYDAFAPRAEAAIAYCDQFPLDDLPHDVQNLLHLIFSLVMVSFPVECWRQPRIPDTGAAALECVVEPGP
jgi:hypothetical protein